MHGYVIIVEEADGGGFGAWSPDLPGCIATAGTYEECLAEMREAITGHLAVMREYGDPIPEPQVVVEWELCPVEGRSSGSRRQRGDSRPVKLVQRHPSPGDGQEQ